MIETKKEEGNDEIRRKLEEERQRGENIREQTEI
jgi:hypothetical protein